MSRQGSRFLLSGKNFAYKGKTIDLFYAWGCRMGRRYDPAARKKTTIPVDDLITGWVTKDGEVEKVEIDGYSTFSSKDIAAFEKELIEVNQTLHYQALHKAVL